MWSGRGKAGLGALCPDTDGRGPTAGRDTLTGLRTDRGMSLESISTLVVKFSVESKAFGIGLRWGGSKYSSK